MEFEHRPEPDEERRSLKNLSFSRRRMLALLGLTGTSLAASSLLAACGGSDDDDPETTAEPGGSGPDTETPTAAAADESTPEAGAESTPAASDGDAKSGGTLRWFLTDDPPDLDPHMQTTSSLQWISGMCYNGLLKYDVGPGNGPESVEAATPVPDLAESYEVSDDGLTYTFVVRQGIKFHDGTDMTTEDVAFSLNRIRSDGAEFQRSYAFTPVESVEATDETTVTVTMTEPYAAFINQVATAYTRIAPQHVIEENGDMKQVMVGTGPFKLDSYQRGQNFVFVRNEDYWEEGIPHLDSIEITIMPDNSTQLAAFTAGQIDIYDPPNYAQIETLQDTLPDIVVNEWAQFGLAGIGCNVSVAPFDDVRVRQALFLAINQDQIIEIVMTGHGAKQRAVPAAYTGWVVPFEELPFGGGRDVERAKELLAEAGYPDGFDVQCKTVYRYTQQEATVATEQLKEIGVNMEIIDVEYGAFLEARNSGDFELIAFGLSPFGDIEDFTKALYHTESSRNYGGWGNEELDELFAQGSQELDVSARQEIFSEVQHILAENCWVIDLPLATGAEAWHPYVKDFVSAQNPQRGLGFREVWLDK